VQESRTLWDMNRKLYNRHV